jgi:hypothetical protein
MKYHLKLIIAVLVLIGILIVIISFPFTVNLPGILSPSANPCAGNIGLRTVNYSIPVKGGFESIAHYKTTCFFNIQILKR